MGNGRKELSGTGENGETGVPVLKFVCSYCNVFVYDEEAGDPDIGLEPGTSVGKIPDSYHCPVCGMPKSYLREVSGEVFVVKRDAYAMPKTVGKDLNYYRGMARQMLTGNCGEFSVCDGKPGRTCNGQKFGAAIGFGGAGQGTTFEYNYDALQRYRFRMRVVKDHHEPEMATTIFGKSIVAPVMGASISGVKKSMNDTVPEDTFYRGLVRGAEQFGTIGLVGNTSTSPDDLGVTIVGENRGWGIPVFKPQSQERLIELFRKAEELDVIAIGVDLEGCGSTYWGKDPTKSVYRKGEKDLAELVDCTEKPVIFKGIMTHEDAGKVVDSGAAACYVSNHGGRVLDCGQGVADVLPEIAKEYRDKITIMADGAVRTGFDVLKLIALGAHVALIGRPIARMSLAGGAAPVQLYYEYVRDDLRRAMLLTGCDTLKDATMDILVRY